MRPRRSRSAGKVIAATDARPALDALTSSASQKQRVLALEAACHRALQSDDFAGQALIAALGGHQPEPEAGASPVVVGLSNVVRVHANMLLDGLKRNDTAEVRHQLLREVCKALANLRNAI